MQLSQEIEKIFTRLKHGHVEPDVASRAVEQLISAHVRKPPAQLDSSIRSVIERMRVPSDYFAVEAEVLAWISLRARAEEPLVMWL